MDDLDDLDEYLATLPQEERDEIERLGVEIDAMIERYDRTLRAQGEATAYAS